VIYIEEDIEKTLKILAEIILDCYLKDLKNGKIKSRLNDADIFKIK
jgi:hypothetical protein